MFSYKIYLQVFRTTAAKNIVFTSSNDILSDNVLQNYFTILKQILAKYVTLKVVEKFLAYSRGIQIRGVARKNGEDEMVIKGSTLHFVPLKII